MRRVVIKILSAALVLFLVAPAVLAAEASTSLTLSQAKDLAMEKSRTLQTLKINRNKLGVSADLAENTYDSTNINNTIDGYVNSIQSMQKQIAELDPIGDAAKITELQGRVAKYEVLVSKLKENKPSGSVLDTLKNTSRSTSNAYEDIARSIKDTEKILTVNVENMFFGLVDLDNAYQIQQKYLDVLGKQLQIERLKKELGMSTTIEVTSGITKYETTAKLIADLKNKRQLLAWQLNDLMGRDIDLTLVIQPETINPIKEFIDVSQVTAKTLKNSLAMQQKEREIREYASDYRTQDDADQRKLLGYGKDLASLELADEKESINEKVQSLISTLGNSYKAWEIAKIDKDNAEQQYNNDQHRYDLGIVSKMQLIGSEVTYLQAVSDETKAAEAWLVAKHKIDLAKEGVFIPEY